MSAIKAYREKHRLTLDQFGGMIGVKKAAVWKYENGVTPPVSVAIAISKATKGEIPIADLQPQVFDAVKEEIERPASEDGAAA